MAKDLVSNLNGLVADFWVLEGSFGDRDLFRNFESANFDILGLDEIISVAIIIVERFEQGDHGCTSEFEELSSIFEKGKQELTQLRQCLEGPIFFNYNIDVHYQIIGNQPNPGQIACTRGTASSSTNRKSSKSSKSNQAVFKTPKTLTQHMTSSSQPGPGYNFDGAAISRLASDTGSKSKNGGKANGLETKNLLNGSSIDAPRLTPSSTSINHPYVSPLDKKYQEIAQRELLPLSSLHFHTSINNPQCKMYEH